ncbi:DGQHR domain-containing protein [Polaribacter sp. Hel_I_88]|uniref:DGQHR domain-containing protein n=1 Tax=Polaribacter sp. Hel_I_88 TaxID=1250006 RepID=UPI000478DFFD|nr:DGQHR domain-containing protein [Polaribacter sp. Hel_I_88]
MKDNIIEGIPVIQNKQDFVITKLTIDQIFKYTKYTSRILNGFDEKGIPIYNGEVQRQIENSRVNKIADFLIEDPEATFPTNIVLHIPLEAIEEQVEYGNLVKIHIKDKVFSELEKKNGDVYITIIDGQHRIKGIEEALIRIQKEIEDYIKTLRKFENTDLRNKLNMRLERLEDLKNIELVVSFFIDKTIEYQAMIFSTINRTQKRVSQSLVYSLFGLDLDDTPQKTALECVIKLNGHENSPFYKRIKFYGGDYSKLNSPPLTQAAMVKSIVGLISESIRESERDRNRLRKELLKRTEGSKKFLPFRKYYANNDDFLISDIFYYYFRAVKEVFKNPNGQSYWEFINNNSKTENIFHTTVGYDSLLKILVDILTIENKGASVDLEYFLKYLTKAKHLAIDDINRYSFNNRGKKFLYLDMSLAIWPSDYIKNTKDKRLQKLRELEQTK